MKIIAVRPSCRTRFAFECVASRGWEQTRRHLLRVMAIAWTAISAVHGQTPLPDTFNPGANNGVWVIAVQTDGRIVVGGQFTKLASQARNFIARLNPDGTLDQAFDPDGDGTVYSLALQPDGKILVGGNFTRMGGQTRNRIARLNADGTAEAGFHPEPGGPNADINALAVQADGKILVAGGFTAMNGQTRHRITRLNADGTLDPDFNPVVTGGSLPPAYIYSLAVQPDGKIGLLPLRWFRASYRPHLNPT